MKINKSTSKVVQSCSLMKKTFQFFGKEKKKYILGVFLGAFELALLFSTPFINKILISIINGDSQQNMVEVVSIIFFVFLLLVPPIIYGKYLQNTATARATLNLRKELFEHICNIPYNISSKYKIGDYVTRLTDDVNYAMSAYNSFAMTCLIRFSIVFPISLILLLVNDWRIAVAGVIYSLCSLFFSVMLNPYVKKLQREAKLEVVNSASSLIEAMRGIPVIKVFTIGDVLAEKYSNICKIITLKKIKLSTITGIAYGVIDFFTYSAQAIGFIIAILISINSTDIASAVFNATLMGMMADSMLRFGTFILLIQPSLVSMERFFQMLGIPTEKSEKSQEYIETNTKNAIIFKNVSFSYDDSVGAENILNNINLTIRNGENLAIVGGSGGGKSTLVKLIQDFYVPTSGKISYFGRDDLTSADIRNLSAYIPQECSVFEGSIYDNILFGNLEADKESVYDAAERSELKDFIESLPEKYCTQIGERGSRLSGGQKQRIAIARAIIKNAPVLLLDEATAALDSGIEAEIQESLNKISKGKTIITVAHRLSTIKNVDRILVMEKGQIVESGNFQELIDKGGRFLELYNNQF